MQKKILVILGHPDTSSLNGVLAEAYSKGAQQAGCMVRRLNLGELKFDPILWRGYHKIQELEPDLIQAQELLLWADHLVFIYPNWWGTAPALLKGFFDRLLLPGFAFRYRPDSPLWDKLLTGRTAHLLVTMDTPSWYYRLFFHSPGHRAMKHTILGFCGVRVVQISEFAPVKRQKPGSIEKWIAKAQHLGTRQ